MLTDFWRNSVYSGNNRLRFETDCFQPMFPNYINWGASFRWPFRPISAWGSIATIIKKTLSTLLPKMRSEGWGHRVGVTYKPKMRNIIIWNIGKIFVPLFSPFWTWIHIRSKKFFNKGQGFFVIVRMNKQIYHCILCISLFMVTIIAPYVQIRPKGRFWMLRVVKFVNQSL